jgi:hypothetical protein
MAATDERAEMAAIVREVIGELIAMPIAVLTLNVNRSGGQVSGRFRAGGAVYDYNIKGQDVTYRPIGGSPSSARADGVLDRPHALPQ